MPRPSDPAGQTGPTDDETSGKDPELVALGARIRALREAAGLTQEGLAAAAELHWTYIGQIERGERNLTYRNLLRLARGLNVDPARLVGEDG